MASKLILATSKCERIEWQDAEAIPLVTRVKLKCSKTSFAFQQNQRMMPFLAMSTCRRTCAVSASMNVRKTIETEIVCFDEIPRFGDCECPHETETYRELLSKLKASVAFERLNIRISRLNKRCQKTVRWQISAAIYASVFLQIFSSYSVKAFRD